ncbi:MAG: fibronectin-binding protein [Candidatus Bathyarchaeota archaeon B24]|nr:MAG: fibronectin-binding protein [Candidatus Bathyarchaeota archaeon B24]
MPRDRMNGVDIAVLLAESRDIVEDAYVDNVYMLDDELVFKLKRSGVSRELVVKPGRALYLTGFEKVKPLKPRSFAMLLRKHVSGLKITRIEQRGLERIVVIHLLGGRGESKLILELFGAGNVILTDKNNVVRAVMRRIVSKDRTVQPKTVYEYPPVLKDPREVTLNDLSAVKGIGSRNLQRALSRATGLPPPYAEEVLLRAGVDPSIRPSKFDGEDALEKVYENLKSFLREVFEKPLKPVVYRDDEGVLVDFSPVPLTMYKGFKASFYKSFGETVDTYFTELELYEKALEEERRLKAEAERVSRILTQQRESLSKLTKQAETFRRVGELLMTKLHVLHRLLPAFKEMVEDLGVEAAEEKLKDEFQREGFKLLGTDMGGKVIHVEGWGVRFKLDTRLSPAENASSYYRLAKEAEEKAKRVREAMKEVEKRVERLKAEEEVLRPKRVGAWYERFRYTFTREGFLIVGGKDASTNELLINRYMEPRDLVFHADYRGSPFVLLKTGTREATAEALKEAAVFTACYSRAWSDGLASLDVFYVKPEQVSKKAPSGEYLARGSFMVRGRKNYLHNVPLRLCLGVRVEGDGVRILVGSEDAVKGWLDAYVILRPGNVDKRRLAEKVKKRLERMVSKKVLRRVVLPIDEVYRVIPGSGGVLEDG